MFREKNKNNVWYLSYRKRYYLTHPLKLVKELFRNIRYSYNRIVKGYCALDWYDFDTWFVRTIPNMLRDMAEKGHGYPGNEEFDTHEKWKTWLISVGDKIEQCDESWAYSHNMNEYSEKFNKMIENEEKIFSEDLTEEEKELKKQYINRELELSSERKQMIKDALSELSEHWDHLWD